MERHIHLLFLVLLVVLVSGSDVPSFECQQNDYQYSDADLLHSNLSNCSRVYKAVNTKTQRPALIKEYNGKCLVNNPNNMLALVGQEIDMLKIVKNVPGVAKLIETYPSSQGGKCLALEWIEGTPLSEFVYNNRKGYLDVSLVKSIFANLALTLLRVNRAGVSHRDIKPENILINGEEVYLIDFGYAVQSDEQDAWAVGSNLFMPPEKSDVSYYPLFHDWWSLAVTGLCMLNPNKVQEHIKDMIDDEEYASEYAETLELMDLLTKMLREVQKERLVGRKVLERLAEMGMCNSSDFMQVQQQIQPLPQNAFLNYQPVNPLNFSDINAAGRY